MYDDADIFVLTASSNAVISVPVRIHKVIMQNTNGSNAVSALLYNALTATGTATAGLTTHLTAAAGSFQMYAEANFNPPLRHQVGLSVTLAGTNPTCRIYYSRA